MTPEANERRIDLIERKYEHGLSPSETTELGRLQIEAEAWVDEVERLSDKRAL